MSPATPLPPTPAAKQQLAAMAVEKARALAEMTATPERYKVCESCGNAVFAERPRCVFCHAYRFDGSAEAVKAAAGRNAERGVIVCPLPRIPLPDSTPRPPGLCD